LPKTAVINSMVQQGQSRHWHVLWTRSNCEQLVNDQLAAKGFDVFLPTINAWSRRGGVRRLSQVPLFGGYLFLHQAIDKESYVEVSKTKGLVRLLGERWDRLDVIPKHEIEGIQKALGSRVPISRHPYLRDGQRVRITSGPLVDVEGVLLQSDPSKGVLVISIHLLRRSIAVEVDCTLVEAA
jgi:transcription termination/antitermination protein NusG